MVRLIAENVGPFDKLDVDFSDGSGRPHLGPHILAGVNGSGKSTLLRSLAWAMDWTDYGFPDTEWRHFLREASRALVHLTPTEDLSYVRAVTADTEDDWHKRLSDWVRSLGIPGDPRLVHRYKSRLAPPKFSWARFGGPKDISDEESLFTIAAYAPVRALSYVEAPGTMKSLEDPTDSCLGFESAIQNEAIQRWLVDLFSRKALAKERGQQFDSYELSLSRFQEALKVVCGEDVHVDVELDPIVEPRLHFRGRNLNFSQLSDGIRTTLGWLADFMMRQDQTQWRSDLKARRPGILLLDEVDIYLHPRWQRILLPAMAKALPHVQVIASSHSPFVISSCSGARVHVLTLDEHGNAQASPPQNAPFGESVTATLKDIFGVESRFDAKTEQDLKTWDDLKKAEAIGKLTPAKKRELDALTHELSGRSEELRLITNSLASHLLSALESGSIPKPSRSHTTKKGIGRSRRGAKLA